TPARNHSATPATLNVLYPPRNLRLQSFAESSRGAATILLCAVDSHPPARLTLLRGGHPVASSPPGGGQAPRQSVLASPSPNALRLEFREASEEDEGEYECQARSALGAARASLTLRLQATRVLVRPSAEVAEGTEVTLTCQAPGAQPGTPYAWFKNGRWVAEGPEPSLQLRGHRSDAGLYGCRAGRGPLAPPAALAVLCESWGGGATPPGGDPRDTPAPRRCRSSVCAATPWSLPGVACHPRGTHTGCPCRRRPAAGAQLRGAGGAPRGPAGLPTPPSCGGCPCGKTLRPPCPSSGVALTVEPSQEVPEGARATLNCSATAWGDKGVNYTWYRDGRWLWEGPSGSFVLGRVSSADAGSYQCQASGTWGTATSVPLSLSVLCECPQHRQARPQPLPPGPFKPLLAAGCATLCPTATLPCPLPDPPRAVSVSTFLESRDGRGAIVLCTAESHPPSSLALHHRGHLLATSLSPAVTPGVRAVPSRNALRVELEALGAAAGGRYVCVATNGLGNATASADFDVHS
ncbi:SN protein, partial [Donacobius atricapilla]|nr:SN protein [Donacobius atricapilla]